MPPEKNRAKGVIRGITKEVQTAPMDLVNALCLQEVKKCTLLHKANSVFCLSVWSTCKIKGNPIGPDNQEKGASEFDRAQASCFLQLGPKAQHMTQLCHLEAAILRKEAQTCADITGWGGGGHCSIAKYWWKNSRSQNTDTK